MPECAHLTNELTEPPVTRPNFTRYAILFTPRPGTALAAFGRSWFGRSGGASTLHAFSGLGVSGLGATKLAASRGRYNGLHVTFKAPFALRHGMGPEALQTRLQSFANSRKPVSTGPLTLARDGRFLVLRPAAPNQNLDWLAVQCVNAFDGFAAQLSPDERNERLAPHLSLYQRVLLESFGDPHVLSEFRFSVNLTGPLEPAQIERVAEALWPVLETICAEGITVDALSLLGDPGGRAPLRPISRHALAG